MDVDAAELAGDGSAQRDVAGIDEFGGEAKQRMGVPAALVGVDMAGAGDSVAKVEAAAAVSSAGVGVDRREPLGADRAGDDVVVGERDRVAASKRRARSGRYTVFGVGRGERIVRGGGGG